MPTGFLAPKTILLLILSCLLQFCGRKETSEQAANPDAQNSVAELQTENRDAAPIFYVQVAAFEVLENAQITADGLRELDHESRVVSDSVDRSLPVYKVQVGPFKTKSEAVTQLERLTGIGFNEAYLVMIEAVKGTKFPKGDDEPLDEQETLQHQLTFSNDCSRPAWSPNGREVAFFRRNDETEGIYTIGTGGGYVSRIIESAAKRRITPLFAWAPSGREIAVVTLEINRDWESVETLGVVNKNGSKWRSLFQVSGKGQRIAHLEWAPDGKKIAFALKSSQLTADSPIFASIGLTDLKVSTDGLRGQSANSLFVAQQRQLEDGFIPGGWKTNNEYVFLANPGEQLAENLPTSKQFEVRCYDYGARGHTVLKTVERTSTPERFQTLEHRGILSGPTRISMIDWVSGAVTLIFSSSETERAIDGVTLARSGDFFFLLNGELWMGSLNGETRPLSLDIESQQFTVAPGGDRFCFSRNGNLFIAKLLE